MPEDSYVIVRRPPHQSAWEILNIHLNGKYFYFSIRDDCRVEYCFWKNAAKLLKKRTDFSNAMVVPYSTWEEYLKCS